MSTYTSLTYHVIFSTKYRKRFIAKSFEAELYSYVVGIIKGERGRLLEIGGVKDHLHILAGFSPAVSVSEMLKRIKGNSSKWTNEEKKLKPKFEWQVGYGAFTVSQSQLPGVREYIRNQEEHHRRMTFEEEFLAFLNKHQIEYDLWNG